MRQPGGIRKKITFWFYLVLTFMIGSSVILYTIVMAVEEKLFNIEKVDIFLKNTLEVRRMEKNFLLYRDQNSMNQWASYLETTSKQLAANENLFIDLSSPEEVGEVRKALTSYQTIFNELQTNSSDDALIHAEIRIHGNILTTLAEDLIIREHQTIRRLLNLTSNTLLFTLPFLVLFFSSVAALLGRGIVSSLKQLEDHAATIATGNFSEAPFTSSNREINNLITAFNRMSRELKNRQQQLVRSEKLASLGTMLAGVAHEFNNPLSNISSSAQILAEELHPKEHQFPLQLVQQISSETSRAETIIKTLLPLAREEKFHRDHYPLKKLWQEVLTLLRDQIGAGITVHLNINSDLTIFADKAKIQQVFINLLKNSADAMEQRGEIHINGWQHQSHFKITIRDTGPGIPEPVQARIFDPFFTTKDVGHGSGLGLFIVHDIMTQHGGTIAITSPGKGCEFTLILPSGEQSNG